MADLTREPVQPLTDEERKRVEEAEELVDDASVFLHPGSSRGTLRSVAAKLRRALGLLDGLGPVTQLPDWPGLLREIAGQSGLDPRHDPETLEGAARAVESLRARVADLDAERARLTERAENAEQREAHEARASYAFREELIGPLVSLNILDPSALLEETLAALAERDELRSKLGAAERERDRLRVALRRDLKCTQVHPCDHLAEANGQFDKAIEMTREAEQRYGALTLEVATLRQRAEASRTDLRDVAHALGYCHEADGHDCHPADRETLLRGVRELQRRADEAKELRQRALPEAAVEPLREWQALPPSVRANFHGVLGELWDDRADRRWLILGRLLHAFDQPQSPLAPQPAAEEPR